MSETKEYYANGWSHFIDCINFDSNAFDSEAIEFMNEFPRHIMDFLDSRDALLEVLKDIQAAPKRLVYLDKREKISDTVHITITRQQMKNINIAITQAEKESEK